MYYNYLTLSTLKDSPKALAQSPAGYDGSYRSGGIDGIGKYGACNRLVIRRL